MTAKYEVKPSGRISRTKEQRYNLMVEAKRIAGEYQPVTLRQLFYLLVNTGWLYKVEPEYKNLGTLVTRMRRHLVEISMPWHFISDAGRSIRQVSMWDGVPDALDALTHQYRKTVWLNQGVRIYLGVEKEALAAVFQSVANVYGVPVIVSHGYPSATYLHDLQVMFNNHRDDNHIVHFFYYGDHDPSGDGIANLFQNGSPEVEGLLCEFHRSALSADQIIKKDIITRPPKISDSRTATWDDGGALAADVDAIPPNDLREMIKADIESVLDMKSFKKTLKQEAKDIDRLTDLAEEWND